MSARFGNATWFGDWSGTFPEFAHVVLRPCFRPKRARCPTSAEIGFSRLVLIGFWAGSLEVVVLSSMSEPNLLSAGAAAKGVAVIVLNCLWWHMVWYGVAKARGWGSVGELCVPLAVACLALAAMYSVLSVWYSMQAMALDSVILLGGLAAHIALLAFWAAFYLCFAVSLLRLWREWREKPLLGDAEAPEADGRALPDAQKYPAPAGAPSHVLGP